MSRFWSRSLNLNTLLLLTLMPGLLALVTASQMAAASAASFLPRRPERR